MTTSRGEVDVSKLPEIAYGSRAPLWWGVVTMVAIEALMFALLLASYAYVARDLPELPPPPSPEPGLLWPTVILALLLVSAPPMRWAEVAARGERDRDVAIWLGLAVGLGFVILAMRGLELAALPYRWDTDAHASLVWVLLGFHTAHVLASTLETAVLLALVVRKPVDDKHELDVAMDTIYWDFVVVSWIPIAAAVYVLPRFL